MNDPLGKFGPIWGASGVQGFFGEGYPTHKYLKPLGLDFDGLTFVAKTTTYSSNKGNMPMKADGITPKEFMPNCVFVSPRSWWYSSALNAVGLSGPGIGWLIAMGEWQKRTKPFFISIMPIEKDREGRFAEIALIQHDLSFMLHKFSHLRNIMALQINYSCPNTGHDMEALLFQLIEETKEHMRILSQLGIPLVPKINVLLPIEKALEIGNNPNCAGLTLSNTIPWNDLPRLGIDRVKIFGSDESPLLKRGLQQPGGYSGKELLRHTANYVTKLRDFGFSKHINAGGGILKSDDIYFLHHAGADSFSLGSVAFLRPWETSPIINRAYEVKNVLFERFERFHM